MDGTAIYQKGKATYIYENGEKRLVDYNVKTKVYERSFERPVLSKKFKEELYSKYEYVGDGKYRSKIDSEELIKPPIHKGHAFGKEHRRYVEAAKKVGIPDQESFNEFINTQGEHFRLENAKRNMSHMDEMPGKDKIDEIIKDMEVFLEKKRGK